MPSLFQPNLTEDMHEMDDFMTIRLFKDNWSDHEFLYCTILSPKNLQNLINSFKSHYNRIARHLKKIPQIERFPRIPEHYVADAQYSKLLKSMTPMDASSPKYLENLIIMLKGIRSGIYLEPDCEKSCKRLYVNIKSFYPSVYTHAIIWTLSGKDLQKERLLDGFEKHIRQLKGNETYGLSCGALVTHDIAELFFELMDGPLLNALRQNHCDPENHGQSIEICRMMDNIVIMYPDSVEKDDILETLDVVLNEYRLMINHGKIKDVNPSCLEFISDYDKKLENITTKQYLKSFDAHLIKLAQFQIYRKSYDNHSIQIMVQHILQSCEILPQIISGLLTDYCAGSDCIAFGKALAKAFTKASSQSIQYLSICWMCTIMDIDTKMFDKKAIFQLSEYTRQLYAKRKQNIIKIEMKVASTKEIEYVSTQLIKNSDLTMMCEVHVFTDLDMDMNQKYALFENLKCRLVWHEKLNDAKRVAIEHLKKNHSSLVIIVSNRDVTDAFSKPPTKEDPKNYYFYNIKGTKTNNNFEELKSSIKLQKEIEIVEI
eukprot:NODE_457_length_7221_cov_0.242207.p2 type:complete len:543 gc:universal NODE_457_length_7221_cov_0.242207:5737-4109(-)